MKIQFRSWPAWIKVLAYFLVLWLATTIAGIIPLLNDLTFFSLVSFVLSWAFLHAEGNTITSLGFVPQTKKDCFEFISGIGTGGLMLIITVIITLYLTDDHWSFNPRIDPIYVTITFFTCFWSAFIQEFVFRGYPFQTLLKQYGPWTAQIFISIPFGLMHINDNMSYLEIGSVMLTTGLGSILFGLGFLKTRKLFLPTGLHLGWNYFQQLIPRTTGGGNTGIIMIPGSEKYSHLIIIGPYLLVVILTIIWFSMPVRSKHPRRKKQPT